MNSSLIVARAYSDDLRRKLLEAHQRGEGTLQVLAKRFSVSVDWAYTISAQHGRTGSMDRLPQKRRGRESQVDTMRIASLLESRTDMTLPELQQELIAATGRRSSVPQLWRVVRAMGSGAKKSIHATERETEVNRLRREAFVAELRTIPPERLIDLDESGVSTQMTRLYGRCRGGRRVADAVPGGDWKIVTILGAMNHQGMLAAMTVEAATDREVFLAFLDEVLCPKLKSGDVLILDNLSAHKVDGVRQRIEAAGARLLYLPPYSPDLNPIEKAWAKLKALLRNAHARTADTLHNDVAQLLPAISPKDATAWFRLPLAYTPVGNLL